MLKKILMIGCFAALVSSCQKEKKNFTDAELHRRVDSAVKENTELLQEQFDEDLDRRMSIEVRPLADSLRRK